jgi:hypothetical protein
MIPLMRGEFWTASAVVIDPATWLGCDALRSLTIQTTDIANSNWRIILPVLSAF